MTNLRRKKMSRSEPRLMPECTIEGKDQYGFRTYAQPAPPKALRHYFIEGAHFGSDPARAIQYQGMFLKPKGLFFFCKFCGRMWAECPVDNETSSIAVMPCERHKPNYSWDVPGSVWLSWDSSWTDSLPKSVLEREFSLHYARTQPPHSIPIGSTERYAPSDTFTSPSG